MFSWSGWKQFPDPQSGTPIEAPIGPGVFEVRRISNGDLVAFDHAANVARALASIPVGGWRRRVFARHPGDAAGLEYRTCAAPTGVDAKAIVARLNTQRRLYWQQALHT